jgi:hypothetical protein
MNKFIKKLKFLYLSGHPAPVREPERKPLPSPAPDKEREPDRPSRENEPVPGKPSPSPGRPSPLPGREPRPITDPKNFLNLLIKEYYHTSPADIKTFLFGITPFSHCEKGDLKFRDLSLLGNLIHREYKTTADLLYNHNLYAKYKENDIPGILNSSQAGHEKEILDLINKYLYDIMGDCYSAIKDRLDIAWLNPYDESSENKKSDIAKSWFSENNESKEKNTEKRERNNTSEKADTEINPDYLKEVILRSEINFLIIQGFSVQYMQGFFRMYRKELNMLHSELADLYELFHLYSRFNHFRIFEDVMAGKKLPRGIDEYMEKNQSQGRVWFSADPVTDENNGDILAINSRAHARSESGVVLAHEALKGSIQLLLPWSRFHETYLNDSERRVHRNATGSFWAEIRQFVIGPFFFRLLQKYYDSINKKSSVSSHEFYTELDSFSEKLTDDLLNLIELTIQYEKSE